MSSVKFSIRFPFLDLTCYIVENVLSHTYVLPNIECVFSAKSFSLGNLSLLTNFQNVSWVFIFLKAKMNRTEAHRVRAKIW